MLLQYLFVCYLSFKVLDYIIIKVVSNMLSTIFTSKKEQIVETSLQYDANQYNHITNGSFINYPSF